MNNILIRSLTLYIIIYRFFFLAFISPLTFFTNFSQKDAFSLLLLFVLFSLLSSSLTAFSFPFTFFFFTFFFLLELDLSEPDLSSDFNIGAFFPRRLFGLRDFFGVF